MKYELHRLDAAGRPSGDAEFNIPSLDEAKALAESTVAQGLSPGAEIRDELGTVLFRRPRAFHA